MAFKTVEQSAVFLYGSRGGVINPAVQLGGYEKALQQKSWSRIADVVPQGNGKILIICRMRKKFERIPEKGICEAESVIDNFFDAFFRGRPQVICPYRAGPNHPFNGWL